MNQCLWRLHLSPTAYQGRGGGGGGGAIVDGVVACLSSTKFDFNLNDGVYIRPKSVKELGISGRIVEITTMEKKVGIASGPCQRNTKRRLVEDVRVSVQQHCHDKNNRIGNCDHVKKGVRPSRLFPVYDICKDEEIRPQSLIILTPDTTNYRQLASSHVRANDKVLEIGCSTGECTALVMRRLVLLHSNPCLKNQKEGGRVEGENSRNQFRGRGRIVAFDIGSDMIEQAKHRITIELNNLLPKETSDAGNSSDRENFTQMVNYHKIDAIADPKGAHTYAKMGDDRSPDIVLIDIGGNRELKAVVRMIRWVQSSFCNEPPRLIIVKSEVLVDEVSISTTHSKGKEGELGGSETAGESVLNRSASNISTVRPVVLANGVIENAEEWFSSLIPSSAEDDDATCSSLEKRSRILEQSAPKYSHPMKAPLVLSPKDNSTAICRWHNYDPVGCKRFVSSRCPYDHDHCHWCREVGHVALTCAN
jgi:hypothetical protein